MLTRVSITGADDDVDPSKLVALSVEFPFVEWAILFSAKRQGGPRFPSVPWIARLRELTRGTPVHLAAHFCWTHTRDTLAGNHRWLLDALGFQRIQFNGWEGQGLARLAVVCRDVELIMQVRSEDMLQTAADVADDVASVGGRASALYDPSGGRGIETFRWPLAPQGLRLGYAGGIRPSTVVDVLGDIGPVDHDFWVDMETGVRVNDKFDIGLAREVLERAVHFVQVAPSVSGDRP